MKVLIVFLISLFMAGCATTQQPEPVLVDSRHDNPENDTSSYNHNSLPLTMHSNAGVRIAARVGYGIGGLIGVPFTLLLFPITVQYADPTDGNLAPLTILAPIMWCSVAGGTFFGSLAWPFFGWW